MLTCLQDLWPEIVIKGIRTCDLWVSVLIRSYRRAMVGGTPEFPGQLIASLLVAQWLGRWCTSLVAQVRFLGYPQKDAAATLHVFGVLLAQTLCKACNPNFTEKM